MTSRAPQSAHLHGHVDRRVSGADHQATVGQGQPTQVIGLAQFADVVGGSQHARCLFIGQAQLPHGTEPKAEKDGIVLIPQVTEPQVTAQALAIADLDAPDAQQKRHFTLGKIINQLIAGDTVLVQATRFLTGFEDDHIVPVHGQTMCTRQARRAGADYCDALAGSRGALEGVFAELGVIQGIALQLANQHRRAFLRVVAHAGLFAEDFGGADTGTTATEDVGRQDPFSSALQVVITDAADEGRNVDVAGAGIDTRSIVAVQAARALHGGLARGQGWDQVAEMLGQLVAAGPWAGQMVQCVYHGGSLSFLSWA